MATTDPKTATEGQWQDLANRVQSKAEIGTVLSTPSSVAYVDTANIVNESVTSEKLGLSYSTSEQATGEKWIDGKTIYRKTVYISSFPNATEKTVSHGISNIGQIISLCGFMATGNGGCWPIPMPPNPLAAITTGIIAFASNTEITIRTGSDRRQYSGYITLYYTKNS
jgi:hypothetical protein